MFFIRLLMLLIVFVIYIKNYILLILSIFFGGIILISVIKTIIYMNDSNKFKEETFYEKKYKIQEYKNYIEENISSYDTIKEFKKKRINMHWSDDESLDIKLSSLYYLITKYMSEIILYYKDDILSDNIYVPENGDLESITEYENKLLELSKIFVMHTISVYLFKINNRIKFEKITQYEQMLILTLYDDAFDNLNHIIKIS